jgi:hypothetical protein
MRAGKSRDCDLAIGGFLRVFPHLSLAGKRSEQEVVVQIFFEPFEDDDPQTIFDVNRGGWRDKGTDGD